MLKRFFVIFSFLSAFILYGASSESSIIKVIFQALYQKQNITVFVSDETKTIIVKEAGFSVATLCSKADIVYTNSILENCTNKPIFTDNYPLFKENTNVIGAFYWSKGRPNIMFSSKRMEKFNMGLPTSLQKYEMSEIE